VVSSWRSAFLTGVSGCPADYNNDGAAEVFVSSLWGVGVLKLAGSTMTALMLQPNGTRFGGWLLNTADNHFIAEGRFANGAGEVLVTSPWGSASWPSTAAP